jgi:transposase
MKELLERCAGLNVHKKTVIACIMIGFGKKVKKEIKTFGPMTDDLKEPGTWLKKNNVQKIVAESTGIYWIPVFNVLEFEMGLSVSLANPRYVKNVKGKKTDVKDSEWLCKLFKFRLIQSKFCTK